MQVARAQLVFWDKLRLDDDVLSGAVVRIAARVVFCDRELRRLDQIRVNNACVFLVGGDLDRYVFDDGLCLCIM